MTANPAFVTTVDGRTMALGEQRRVERQWKRVDDFHVVTGHVAVVR